MLCYGCMPDFASDIDPGPGTLPGVQVYIGRVGLHRCPSARNREALTGVRRFTGSGPSFIDSLNTGAERSFPRYEGALGVQDLLGAIEEELEVLLRASELGYMYLLVLVVWIRVPECPGRSQLASQTCQTLLVPLIRVPGGPFPNLS